MCVEKKIREKSLFLLFKKTIVDVLKKQVTSPSFGNYILIMKSKSVIKNKLENIHEKSAEERTQINSLT